MHILKILWHLFTIILMLVWTLAQWAVSITLPALSIFMLLLNASRS